MKNLTGMAIFARVVEARSFSEAARRLGLSKSMVSKEVSRLEKSLGAHLLKQTTRKLSLTQIGTADYEHCARIVQEANDAELLVGGPSVVATSPFLTRTVAAARGGSNRLPPT